MHTSLLKSAATGLLLALLFPLSAFADTQSLEQVLQSIRTAQNISETESIDCAKITAEEFETLGDAVMGVMHPENAQHELMDTMMGGEGSASLTAMHSMMGTQYLDCISQNIPEELQNTWNSMQGGMMGMMNSGMMGSSGTTGMMGGSNMMGNFDSGSGMMGWGISTFNMMSNSWPVFSIFALLLLIAVVAGIYYVSKKKNAEFEAPLSVTKFGWRLTAVLEIIYLICLTFMIIFWGAIEISANSTTMPMAFWPLGIIAGAFNIFIISWIASAIFVWIFNTSFSGSKKM